MSQLGYIYLLQDGRDKNTKTYKVGRTTQKGGDSRRLNRLHKYTKGTVVYNTFFVDANEVNRIEQHILSEFKQKYRLVRGLEWFEGDVSEMKKDIDMIIEQWKSTEHSCENILPMEPITQAECKHECSHCGYTTQRACNLKRHMKLVHQAVIVQENVLTKTIAPSKGPSTLSTTNNNTSNNITHIHVNDFGEEDLSYITPSLIYSCLLQKNGVGLFNLFKYIHMNMDAPQNHNIRDHPRRKMVEVRRENKWVIADCEHTLETALRKCCQLLLSHSNDAEFRETLPNSGEWRSLVHNHVTFGPYSTPNYFYRIRRMFCCELMNLAREYYKMKTLLNLENPGSS
jgi:hypothetical protein